MKKNNSKYSANRYSKTSGSGESDKRNEKPKRRKKVKRAPYVAKPREKEDAMRLNKYIAHSGICSRREADTMISDGKVSINGSVVTELGTTVNIGDLVEVNGQKVYPEPYVYILIYKPRDTITTTSDEKGRKTVMDLVERATGKRVYPVGRLDRNTTGILLLTNDGELANRLMHPSYTIGKVYEAECDRALSDDELLKLKKGIELEDGKAKAYFVNRDPVDTNLVILGVHEGRYHLVRRMIESLDANVVKLKRVKYAGLTLKGLRQGRWRYLTPNEVNDLRNLVKLKELKIIKK